MNNIVLYQSKYGHSMQYATWIAEELNWELKDFKKFKKSEIKNYQNIIFGSGVFIGKMNHIKTVLKWFKDKPIILFACAGNNNVQSDIDEIKKANFTHEQLSFHHFFYLPGGVDFTKVNGFMKSMMNVFIKMIDKKQDKTRDEIALLESYKNPTYFVDKIYINDLISYVQNSSQSSFIR